MISYMYVKGVCVVCDIYMLCRPPSANICQTIMVLLLHSCVQNPKVRIEKLQQFSQNIATCCDQVCTNTHPMDTVGIVWIGCCPSAMAYVISQAENVS